VCAIHALLWTLAVCFFSATYPWMDRSVSPDQCTYVAIGWLFGTHFLMDRFRLAAKVMDFTGQKGFKANLGPWAVIVVDNTWHLVTIWLAYVANEHAILWTIMSRHSP
jgi:hypothetical protein